MKRLYSILFLACCIQFISSQSVGTWKTYLAYHHTTSIAEGNNYVFAVADGSLYCYGKDDKSVMYYSKQTGLSDNQISTIAYNASENTLVIAYTNGNIDLLSEKGIRNISYLKESNFQNKQINTIYIHNEYAYLCGGFGIIMLDIKKNEIKETYRLNKSVSSLLINNNTIYAVADNKILRANLNDNLIDPNSWKNYSTANTDIDAGKVYQICLFQNTLCVLVNNNGIFCQTNEGFKKLISHGTLRGMKVENEKLITYSGNDIYIYISLTERETTSGINVYDVSSLKEKNTIWLAAGNQGILGLKRTGSNQYEKIESNLNIDGPIKNLAAFLLMYKDKLYIGGGGRWSDRLNNYGTVMIYDPTEKSWLNLDSATIARESKIRFSDVTSIAIDPENENHYYVSTWGEGVFEFIDNKFVKLYNRSNSTLETANEDWYPNNFIRVEGLCYDKNNNLWMTNVGNNVIKVLKADGTWNKISYPEISFPSLSDKILIRENGDKWLNLVRGDRAGIFVFNENGTIEDTSDDKYRYFTSLNDANSNPIGTNYYFCIAEDKNNDLWIGTDRGPIILYNPSRVLSNLESAVLFNRIIRTDENGSNSYFLSDEQINAIAVDGGNRKWIGTSSSGLFLVSEDGKETLEHFTTENSFLLSNNVQSITIDDRTGEVFIGTDNGLISYFGEAIRGKENYSDVYAYPNPVRPDFDEKVIITGLMENSNIKITDVNGNLIYQTKSVGGQASWDCKNRSGRRVASGVYLVLSSTPNAKENVVTKIAVVK